MAPLNRDNNAKLEDYLSLEKTESSKKSEYSKKTKEDREGKPFNASFLTLENIQWWLFITMTYLPPENKRLVFLPCAGGHKTRGKLRENDQGEMVIDNRKFISESTSHQYMKAIREDPLNERVILSEPCTIIPVCLENHKLRKDYNLPVDFLSVQGEFIFIERLSHYLLKLKMAQPSRRYIFYFGGCHHFFILNYANKLAGSPFGIIYRVPKEGTCSYGRESALFMEEIREMERTGNFRIPIPISIEAELNKRTGRYTHKPFLLALIEAERIGNSKTEVKESRIEVSKKDAFVEGFSIVYFQIGKENLTTIGSV